MRSHSVEIKFNFEQSDELTVSVNKPRPKRVAAIFKHLQSLKYYSSYEHCLIELCIAFSFALHDYLQGILWVFTSLLLLLIVSLWVQSEAHPAAVSATMSA